jgi:hypothetical protein
LRRKRKPKTKIRLSNEARFYLPVIENERAPRIIAHALNGLILAR